MAKKTVRTTVQPRKKQIVTRINKITGQLDGIKKMIEEDRYCTDILSQLSSARAALDSIGAMIIEDHTKHCVKHAISAKRGDTYIEELVGIIKKYNR